MHPPFFVPAPPADRPSVLRTSPPDVAPPAPTARAPRPAPDPQTLRLRLGHWLIRMGETLTEPRPAR